MKQIPLTKGLFALVDDEDYDFLMQWKWHASKAKQKSAGYYARRDVIDYSRKKKNGKHAQKHVHMHHAVLWLRDKPILVDHWDGDTLNNQKYNLREATKAQNRFNCRACGKSKYIGVTPPRIQKRKYVCKNGEITIHKSKKSWAAAIGKKHLGYFESEADAAKAYDEEAKKRYGIYARLNFPISTIPPLHAEA